MSCVCTATMVFILVASLLAEGCGQSKGDPKAEAPPPTTVERGQDADLVQVDHPERFPLAIVTAHQSTTQLVVTGTVAPDVSRSVPVISIATGRVVEIHARLGDSVKKGQVLLRVHSADLSSAYSDYRKALADETLAQTQFARAKLLYNKGAISLNDFETAEDVQNKAQVDVENNRERLRVLGANPDRASSELDIVAPVSGVITDQQITNAAGVAGLGSPNPFTISDLSYVWILCDVYENDLPRVHLGETAEIRLNAYPKQAFTGRVGNVLPILDPTIRTAKVRIEMRNPGMMRLGMFVTATFREQKKEMRAVVPGTAILHLHDRDWVYVPDGDKKFRRINVVAGPSLPDGAQEIVSGLQPGGQVVTNALVLQSTGE